jgi:putative mycofactocin binding protein MftB
VRVLDLAMPVVFDTLRPWALNPRVAVRPEPFGALLYNFGTRQLSFLKDPRLVDVVRALAHHPDAVSACLACKVEEHELPQFGAALARLAATDMVIPRTTAEANP